MGKKWCKKFLPCKNTQAGARSENAMFLQFTHKNIRNARSWKSSRKKTQEVLWVQLKKLVVLMLVGDIVQK